MSIKINALIPAAAAAAGIPTPTASPIAESLLATVPVLEIHCSEIADSGGKIMMFAKVGADTRAVAGTDGNVKLYSTAIAALKAAKAADLRGPLQFALYEKPITVGDPLEGLKTRYKSSCSKGWAAVNKYEQLRQKIDRARIFGWDEATGPTRAEYNDLEARLLVLLEWRDTAISQVSGLETLLSDVDVDPASIVPNPPRILE